MSSWSLPLDVIRNIFSYGDVDDIQKRKMVFDQLLFLKKEHEFNYRNIKYSCNFRPFYIFCLKKLKIKITV
tara:strand:- start:2732 stop:2944 length:213 start_codon:yes stop_codon:yes gene_type:complete